GPASPVQRQPVESPPSARGRRTAQPVTRRRAETSPEAPAVRPRPGTSLGIGAPIPAIPPTATLRGHPRPQQAPPAGPASPAGADHPVQRLGRAPSPVSAPEPAGQRAEAGTVSQGGTPAPPLGADHTVLRSIDSRPHVPATDADARTPGALPQVMARA